MKSPLTKREEVIQFIGNLPDFEKTWYSWLLKLLLKSLQNTTQIIILNIHTFHVKLWKVSDKYYPFALLTM